MGITAAIVAGAATVYSSEKSATMQERAQRQSLQQAKKQEKQSQIATNRANQKKPNTGAILSRAQQAGKGGQSGTMLTGSQGVDPNSLTLGKNTLLGS